MKFGKLFLKIGLFGIAGLVLGYFLLVSFLFFGPKVKSYADRMPFESSTWKVHLDGKEPTKQYMVDDLLSRYQLVGMRDNEIEELLGRPPQTNYFKDYDYVYWLGPERSSFGIDSEWLGIKFHDGFAIKADILRD